MDGIRTMGEQLKGWLINKKAHPKLQQLHVFQGDEDEETTQSEEIGKLRKQ